MIENHQITGRQIAAALGLLRMTQSELAKASKVSVPTLGRMIASEGPATGMTNNVSAVRSALEAQGLEFLSEADGGEGVRLKLGDRIKQESAIGPGGFPNRVL